jgi:hypothetical protein
MAHITADRAIRQPRRRPGQHEPRDHVSLKPLNLLPTGRNTHLAQIPHDRQPHRDTPDFSQITKTSTSPSTTQKYRDTVRCHKITQMSQNPWSRARGKPQAPTNPRVVS